MTKSSWPNLSKAPIVEGLIDFRGCAPTEVVGVRSGDVENLPVEAEKRAASGDKSGRSSLHDRRDDLLHP